MSQKSKNLSLSTAFGDMKEYTLLDIFEGKSLKGIVRSRVYYAVKKILEEPDLSKDFFYKVDALTRAVYGSNGKYVMVQPVPGFDGLPKYIYLGDQKSIWHDGDDKIGRHTGFTTGEMIRIGKNKKKGVIDTKIAAAIGALHDVGKKYTAHISQSGLSFYGHAQLSAYIAWHWLNKLNLFSEEERKAIVAAIYGHDIVKQQDPVQKAKYHAYLGELGNKINRMNTKYCETLIKADSGVIEVTSEGYKLFRQEYSPDKGKVLKTKPTITKKWFNRLVRLGREAIDSIVA